MILIGLWDLFVEKIILEALAAIEDADGVARSRSSDHAPCEALQDLFILLASDTSGSSSFRATYLAYDASPELCSDFIDAIGARV